MLFVGIYFINLFNSGGIMFANYVDNTLSLGRSHSLETCWDLCLLFFSEHSFTIL